MSEDRKVRMDSIRSDFSDRSEDYDEEIARSVPNYAVMLQAAVDSLPFEVGSHPIIFDLGTGTGALAIRVLERFPDCQLTCVDMTREMLEIAKRRLGEPGGVTFLEKDFYDLELPGGLDAVVSSLALHHLVTDDDKRSFYAMIHGSLRPGGVFVNADAVLSSDAWVEKLYKGKWVEFMGRSMSKEQIERILERHSREDSLPVLTDQLLWLMGAGFSKVDVIWKDHMGAVVWARK